LSTHYITQDPVSRNGNRPHPPGTLETLPALLGVIDELRDDLVELAYQTEALMERADEALTFIDYRVELARTRERRRDRKRRRA
jgi:hypothetical protein